MLPPQLAEDAEAAPLEEGAEGPVEDPEAAARSSAAEAVGEAARRCWTSCGRA